MTKYNVKFWVNGKEYAQRGVDEKHINKLKEMSMQPFDIPKMIPPHWESGPISLIIPAGAAWHIEYREVTND